MLRRPCPMCNSLPIGNRSRTRRLALALPVQAHTTSYLSTPHLEEFRVGFATRHQPRDLPRVRARAKSLMRRYLDLIVPRSRLAGVVIGIGLGGFIDGILLHQIAHWHNMGSSVLPPTTLLALEQNMRWDGVFHAVTWLITLAGIYMLRADAARRLAMPSARELTGQLMLG